MPFEAAYTRRRRGFAVKTFDRDSDAPAALFAGHADVYLSDDLGVPYLCAWAKRVTLAASRIQSAPIGIATRKDDPLGNAVRRAIRRLYASGEMKGILARWGFGSFALGK